MKRLFLGLVVLAALCVDLPGTMTNTATTVSAAPVAAQPVYYRGYGRRWGYRAYRPYGYGYGYRPYGYGFRRGYWGYPGGYYGPGVGVGVGVY